MVNTMHDRLTNGFIAGFIGGSVSVALSLISKAIGITEMRVTDFTAHLLFGRPPMMLTEDIWAGVVSAVAAGFFGIIFYFLILLVGKKYLYFKGLLYGISAWYVWYSMILMVFSEKIDIITLSTSLSSTAVSSIYGLILALVYNNLYKETEV